MTKRNKHALSLRQKSMKCTKLCNKSTESGCYIIRPLRLVVRILKESCQTVSIQKYLKS
jgi:hypothetical protein